MFIVEGNQLGEKSVTEQASAGWSLTDVTCSQGTVDGATVTVDLAAGDDVTCTYVNKKDATVTVIKDAQPNSAQDFDYTTTGSQLSDFSLDDDADATLSDTQVFTVSGPRLRFEDDHGVGCGRLDNPNLDCSEGTSTVRRRHSRSIRATTSRVPT